MANYGIKTSKKGVDATTATGTDIIMSTKFPFAKIDPTRSDTFRTTTVTFITDPPDNVKTLVAQFAHGYSYKPQLWGLWNVTWPASFPIVEQNGYGSLNSSSSINSVNIRYEWDATNVYLYMTKTNLGIPFYSVIGTTAKLSTYIFVDDLQEQNYTS